MISEAQRAALDAGRHIRHRPRPELAYRDAAIRESRRQGLSLRQIAAAYGLAHSRVHAILSRNPYGESPLQLSGPLIAALR